MIRFLLLAVVSAAATSVIGPPMLRSQPTRPATTITVVGQNDPAVDLHAMQRAVDAHDTVIARGTFDFGSEGSVIISKPLKLIGQVETGQDSARVWKTTIKGGLEPITIRNPTDGSVAIRDISLEGATGTAILYLGGRDLEISGVRIASLAPGEILREVSLPDPFVGRLGISASDMNRDRETMGRIDGRIEVTNSVFDMSDHTSRYARAIVTIGGSADVTIQDNEIEILNGANTIGIETYLGSQTVVIERNKITAKRWLIVVQGSHGPAYVRHNTGEAMADGGAYTGAVQVSTLSQDAGEIADNDFVLRDAAIGITTAFPSEPPIPYRGGLIRNNSIRGSITHQHEPHGGVVLLPESHDNVLEQNDLSGLVYSEDGAGALRYHLSIGTSGNVVRLLDSSGTFRDEGTNNQIVP